MSRLKGIKLLGLNFCPASDVYVTFVFVFFILVEVDDLKKITNSLTVLCSEKQKQEKVGLGHTAVVFSSTFT